MLQYKYLVVLVAILVISLSLFAQYYFQIEVEGMQDTMPIEYADAPAKTKIKSGYYQVDANNMAQIPSGYIIDPTNNQNILPNTQTAISSLQIKGAVPSVPSLGQPIPDGYYLKTATSLGLLPPNMMPKVASVDVSLNQIPPTLLIYYNTGYTTKQLYYEQTFPTPASIAAIVNSRAYTSTNPHPAAPPTMFFVDPDYKTVSFLPYGKIQDPVKGYGFTSNPNLISKTGTFDYGNTNYKDISNNYNAMFHDSPEQLINNDDSVMNFDQTPVLDQCGNIIILPKTKMQGNVTYYQPGSFPFGASTYIPKYEDSVYMSRVTQMSSVSPYQSSNQPLGACVKYANMPAQQEEYCRTLDTNTCSATSCCVLLGGSKCVAGNANGPTYKNNYGDYLVRNKDSYYYNGQCYGNCV